jgi:outer membrane immunogenic protein
MSGKVERIPSCDTVDERFAGWAARPLVMVTLGPFTPWELWKKLQGQSHGDPNLRILSQAAFVAAVGGAFVATPALAASFDGPYVGAQVGWQSEKMRDVKSSFGTIPVNDTKDSITGGVFVGYDATINRRFVVGAEAGVDLASDDEVQASSAGTNYSVDPKYSFDVTARAGYLVDPKTLLYVRGGYTNARVRATVVNGTAIESASRSQDGWLAGAGVERQVAQNVTARLEYRFSKFGEGDGKDDRHRVLAGLAYRF